MFLFFLDNIKAPLTSICVCCNMVFITNQDICASNRRKLQIFNSTLLQLHIRVADLAIAPQNLLNGGFCLWEKVDKLDVG